MKHLHVIASVNPEGGGPIEGIRQISAVAKQLGYAVEVASLDSPDAPFLRDFPIPVHPLGPMVGRYGYTSRLVPWLRANAGDYDIVILNGIWMYSSFGGHLGLKDSGVPYVVFTHGMLDPYFKTFPLKHLKKSLYWPLAEYRVLRDAAGVCFTCEEEKILARGSFAPYRCNEIVVNYGTAGPPRGGVNEAAQRAAFVEAFPELAGKRLLLFLSRIHPKKGCDLLIDGFAAVAKLYPTLRLVMAGPDQTGWKAELSARAAKAGVADRITWAGMLSGDKKWGAFRCAEAFVLPSHQENFGIVVAEALACGTPVLITTKVNIWREIESDGAGLVESDTGEGITRLLTRWLHLPDAERQRMREAAQTCFLSRFEIESAAHSLFRVLTAYKK